LLIHGEKDTDVPCEQSRIMAERLKDAGVEHELATYPDMFHAFDGFWPAPLVRAQADDAFDRALRFVNAHTRPATIPREERESPR
jgi:dipeptidyl aminopeptidase/acylaminoacyl peptidase